MPTKGTPPDLFDFSQHLSGPEIRLLSTPQKWHWQAACLPAKRVPLKKHRQAKWMRDPANVHSPPQRELLFALRGETVIFSRGELYAIRPGDLFLFDHYEIHGLRLPPDERNFRHFWLHLPSREQMATNIFAVNADGVANDKGLKFRSDSFVHLIFDAWSSCASQPHSTVAQALLKSVVTAAILEALGRPTHLPAIEVEQHAVEYIERYIENHLEEPLTLTSLAKLAGYNPFSFHRIFKRHRQVTLHRFIMARRVVKARKLLLQGLSVESVAEAVGLSSAAVFSRFFKAQAELAPSSWRKENRYEIE